MLNLTLEYIDRAIASIESNKASLEHYKAVLPAVKEIAGRQDQSIKEQRAEIEGLTKRVNNMLEMRQAEIEEA